MKLPIPPFAWPLLLGFLVALYFVFFPPKFPILSVGASAFYGFLFLSFCLLAVLVGVIGWVRERARDRKRTAA